VLLYDLDPKIVGVWDFLINAKVSEIMALPLDFETLDDFDIPQEAKWFIGYCIGNGKATPSKTKSPWCKQDRHSGVDWVWTEVARHKVASQVKHVRHWKIKHSSYADIPNIKAHWFIDPPYQEAGVSYKCSSKGIDFDHLGSWCLNRRGTFIVCENAGAEWLPFRHFKDAPGCARTRRSNQTQEVVFVGKNS
jgi:hypothetical protein